MFDYTQSHFTQEVRMFSIIIGIIFIIGGLSGGLVLRGTNSGGLLALVGVFLIIWGVHRLTRQNRT